MTGTELSTAEASQLRACETVIARGIHAFNDVGNSLVRVRDGRLYRARYSTFEEYCEARWQISRSRAYQLVGATETLSTIVDKIDVPPPTNEGQLRALAAVPEDDRADVWTEAHERTDGKPTAAAIRSAAEERADRREPAPLADEILDELMTANVGSFVAVNCLLDECDQASYDTEAAVVALLVAEIRRQGRQQSVARELVIDAVIAEANRRAVLATEGIPA